MSQPTRKILVHTCCLACASYVFSQLEKAGFIVVAFFFNPEVDDYGEHRKRLLDLTKYCSENGLELIVPEYNPEEFTGMIMPYKDKNSIKYITDNDRYRRRRCQLCNSMVIQKTVEQAKKNRFKYATTTLLCSPYKDHDAIIEIGNEKSLDYGVSFYYQDFRKGYWTGRNFARNHRGHLPSYCGCLESFKEGRLE